jgi:Flp pilus assembly protein TadD/ketosteroid isomerase-like protein
MLMRLFAQGAVFAGLMALLFAPSFVIAGSAEDLKEASKLYQQNRFDAAMTKVNGVLAQAPKDAQGRFLKGLIFTEQKKTADAIQMFTGLTEDFPELPEPYNNLAVLYAAQGNYDKAKAALELAIHTHPTYGTAYENLGDIYAQLARRSYDKALQLDKTNATAQSKLAMVKDLFQQPRPTLASASAAAAKPDPVKVAVAPTPTTTPAPPSKPVVTASTTPAQTIPVAPPTTTTSTAGESAEAQISAAIRGWAEAWSSKDVLGYLSYYSTDFETPDKLTRADWEAQRKVRIESPTSISVNVKISKISIIGNEAIAVFQQKYKSDKFASDNTKTLKLVKTGDRWMIRSERGG